MKGYLRSIGRWQRATILLTSAFMMVLILSGVTLAQSSEVTIKDIADTPLKISVVKVESDETFLVHIKLTNTTDKPICSYSIRHDDYLEGKILKGLSLNNSPTQRLLFMPGESRNEVVGAHYRDIERIEISADFVEFLDGKSWGPDTFKSGERLAGTRVGALTTAELLTGMLDAEGPIAVMNFIANESFNISPPAGHSSEWLFGFSLGINSIRDRLRNFEGDQSQSNIESILLKPIDAASEFEIERHQ
jgi:hypothetical protein